MKPLANDIVLRPRFQLELSGAQETLLEAFTSAEKPPFRVKRLDEHIFIRFDNDNNHFWSPQLHLEVDRIDKKNSRLYGVFGPNPMLWSFFMFLHFGVGTAFIILGVWAYSSNSLNKPFKLQLFLMGVMVVLWFVLYILGRAGKSKGKPQIQELYRFMVSILN